MGARPLLRQREFGYPQLLLRRETAEALASTAFAARRDRLFVHGANAFLVLLQEEELRGADEDYRECPACEARLVVAQWWTGAGSRASWHIRCVRRWLLLTLNLNQAPQLNVRESPALMVLPTRGNTMAITFAGSLASFITGFLAIYVLMS